MSTATPDLTKNHSGLTYDEYRDLISQRPSMDDRVDRVVPDLPRIKAEIEWAETHPEEWNQMSWGRITNRFSNDCGTAFCIGGHTVVKAGFRTKIDTEYNTLDFYWPTSTVPSTVRAENDRDEDFDNLYREGNVGEVAGWLLGLTTNEASGLFSYDNGIPELWGAYAYIEVRAKAIAGNLEYSLEDAYDASRKARRDSRETLGLANY
jgi:hypothetical protein